MRRFECDASVAVPDTMGDCRVNAATLRTVSAIETTQHVRNRIRTVQHFGSAVRMPDDDTPPQPQCRRALFRYKGVDIPHKQAEAARDEALNRAENANKAKSDFLAAMSHELRTPLNAILGFSDVIQNQLLGPLGERKYGDYARHIHASGTLLLDLVNDILDIAAIEAGRKNLSVRDVDLGEVVDECLAIVDHRAKQAGVALIKQLEEVHDKSIKADRRALQQVLLNLLTNAVKYTPAGGHVSVSAQSDSAGTEITVSDTGCGIPPDRIAEVTDPFVRGSGDPHIAHEGWGLGLSIAKSLVELHHGELRIDSAVGDGTSVRISLPRQIH
jgi:two-component system cell cycle sensor histidine kinase PleC